MSEKRPSALLLIDVIGEFDFTGSEDLLRHALPAAGRLARLKAHLRDQGVPVIHVNDQCDLWGSDFGEHLARCLRPGCPGREIAEALRPVPGDHLVTKPKSSGFFQTSLETLLLRLGVRELILGGFAGDMCVLHTAIDASMRDDALTVIADGIASESESDNDAALAHMAAKLNARILTVDACLNP